MNKKKKRRIRRQADASEDTTHKRGVQQPGRTRVMAKRTSETVDFKGPAFFEEASTERTQFAIVESAKRKREADQFEGESAQRDTAAETGRAPDVDEPEVEDVHLSRISGEEEFGYAEKRMGPGPFEGGSTRWEARAQTEVPDEGRVELRHPGDDWMEFEAQREADYAMRAASEAEMEAQRAVADADPGQGFDFLEEEILGEQEDA